MLTKLYFALWVIGILTVAVVFSIGAMTPIVAVTFGFLSFGMVFMGMISVLPTSVHDSIVKH